MNERMRELLEQAGVNYIITPKDTVYERFAELLIHETARLFDSSEKSELGYRIADRNYKHFDIK
jgi:hypothetical protein